MAFEETTIDEMLKRIQKISEAVTEYKAVVNEWFPQIKDDPTPERMLLSELGKLTLILSNEVAHIGGTFAQHIALEAQLRHLDEGS